MNTDPAVSEGNTPPYSPRPYSYDGSYGNDAAFSAQITPPPKSPVYGGHSPKSPGADSDPEVSGSDDRGVTTLMTLEGVVTHLTKREKERKDIV